MNLQYSCVFYKFVRITLKAMRISLLLIWFLAIFPFYSISQDNSTWGDIYEYYVGDIFHKNEYLVYNGWIPWTRLTVSTVTDVTYTYGQDTVFIEFWIEDAYKEYPDSIWTFESYSSTTMYVNLNTFCIADTVFHSPEHYGRKLSFIEDYATGSDTKWRKYLDGCGQINYFVEHIDAYPWKPSWQEIKEIVYYKKGTEEWGTPNPIVSIEEKIEFDESILLFPNPTSNILNISNLSEQDIHLILAYSNNGSLIKSYEGGTNFIDISEFPLGYYILILQTRNGWISKKFVKN